MFQRDSFSIAAGFARMLQELMQEFLREFLMKLFKATAEANVERKRKFLQERILPHSSKEIPHGEFLKDFLQYFLKKFLQQILIS